jgi:hypothetical protein
VSGYIPYPLNIETPDSEIEIEAPFDELTVHSREETVHSCEETVHSRD